MMELCHPGVPKDLLADSRESRGKVFASVPLSEPSYEEPYDALAYSVAEPVRGVQAP